MVSGDKWDTDAGTIVSVNTLLTEAIVLHYVVCWFERNNNYNYNTKHYIRKTTPKKALIYYIIQIWLISTRLISISYKRVLILLHHS